MLETHRQVPKGENGKWPSDFFLITSLEEVITRLSQLSARTTKQKDDKSEAHTHRDEADLQDKELIKSPKYLILTCL